MSWNDPSFAPEPMRRRSRSRSPDRRPYERYDRDLAREREWAEYERERAEWEYRRANPMGIRGRSRSPGSYDDRRPKRRRSMSPPYPYERDRYDPRPRYDEFHDPRGPPPGRYSPPPRGYRQYSPPRNRGLASPWEMDYPAAYRYFCDWYRMNNPHAGPEEETDSKNGAELDAAGTPVNPMRKRYNEYRRFITNRQVQILFDYHKTSAWFLERYSLTQSYVDLRTRVRKNGLKGKINDFIHALQDGKYDPSLEMESVPLASAGNGASTWGDNGEQAKEEQPDADVSGMMDEGRVEDDLDINMFDQEGNGEPTAGGTASGSVATNGHNKVLLGTTGSVEEVSVEPEGVQIMIRTIPPDIGRLKIEEVCSKIPGFMYLALGDPMQKRNYYRCGWIRFEDDVDVVDVNQKLSEAKIDGFRMQVSHSTRPFTSRCRVTPTAACSPERIQIDLDNVRKLTSIMEEEADRLANTVIDGETSDMDTVEAKDRGTLAVESRAKELIGRLEEKLAGVSEDNIDSKKNTVILDLYLTYLRHAFHCCYYCAVVGYHDEELLRKCIKHVRGTPTTASENKEERWIEWLNSKIALLLDRENVDPVVYGGKDYQKELSRACEPHLKREEEGKFRCGACNKLFKAESFVEKHIVNKHPDVVSEAKLDDIPFFNSFALDPHRIQPFTHPPPPTGNQAPPLAAYGLRNPVGGGGTGGRDMMMMSNGGGFHDIPPPRQPYPHYSYPPLVPPPLPMGGGGGGGGYYGEYNPQPYAPARRFSPPGGRRRLSDRVGERMADGPLVLTGGEGLPPRPITVAEPMSERGREGSSGAPPPPPPKIKEDPRAAQGRKISYMDMDEVAEGDVELNY